METSNGTPTIKCRQAPTMTHTHTHTHLPFQFHTQFKRETGTRIITRQTSRRPVSLVFQIFGCTSKPRSTGSSTPKQYPPTFRLVIFCLPLSKLQDCSSRVDRPSTQSWVHPCQLRHNCTASSVFTHSCCVTMVSCCPAIFCMYSAT